jgi:hypothetical protein
MEKFIGRPFLMDAASAGSSARRRRAFWTNLAPGALVADAGQAAASPTRAPVTDHLPPEWTASPVRQHDTRWMQAVNVLGEVRRLFPTFVSFPGSAAFCTSGSRDGLVCDPFGRWREPPPTTWELAMGFQRDATAIPGWSAAPRQHLLGQAMDINCLSDILGLSLTFQLDFARAELRDLRPPSSRLGGVPPPSIRWWTLTGATDGLIPTMRCMAFLSPPMILRQQQLP